MRLSAFTNQREPLEKSAYIFRAHSQLPQHVVFLLFFYFFFVLGISINKKAKMELNEFSHLLSLLSVCPPFHPLPLVTSF